jgi:V/A-type H+-transporting ATPase subunit D
VSRLNVPPTKSSQLRLREDLDMASEGFALLDQKREILVLELMRLLEHVRQAEKALEAAKQKAYETLRKALAQNGSNRMQRVASGISYDHAVQVHTRVVAGVRIPQISVQHGQFRLQYGFSDTDSLVDETMRDFLELLNAVGEMARLETAVWLLARELKKTQRRVNALEQIFIPDFRDTLHYISETLESKELEAFTIMKIVKSRREGR